MHMEAHPSSAHLKSKDTLSSQRTHWGRIPALREGSRARSSQGKDPRPEGRIPGTHFTGTNPRPLGRIPGLFEIGLRRRHRRNRTRSRLARALGQTQCPQHRARRRPHRKTRERQSKKCKGKEPSASCAKARSQSCENAPIKPHGATASATNTVTGVTEATRSRTVHMRVLCGPRQARLLAYHNTAMRTRDSVRDASGEPSRPKHETRGAPLEA